MVWGNLIRKLIDNDLGFILLKISFSLIIGLIGSTIVLTNLNQFAFYNFILSQGAPTPESGFKYIEFFVVVLSIFLSLGSILFALLLTIVLRILDIPAELARPLVSEKMPKLVRSTVEAFLIFIIVSITVAIAISLINYFELITYVTSAIFKWPSNFLETMVSRIDSSQIGFSLLLIVSLYVLVLIFRPQTKAENGNKEESNNSTSNKSSFTRTKQRSLLAKILLFLVPLFFNSALLVYVGWTLKEPARYAELLRSIRHGGNMEVYLCFDNPEKYGVSVENCGDGFALNGEPSILIGHTDTEVIWRNLKSPDTYVTKWSEIKSYIIKAGKSGDFSDTVLREEFTNTGDVSYVPILQRADLQQALMVLLPR